MPPQTDLSDPAVNLHHWRNLAKGMHTPVWEEWRTKTDEALVEYGERIHIRVTATELARLCEWLALQGGESIGAEIARRVVEAAGRS